METRRRRPARRGQGDRLRSEIIAAACAVLGETGDVGVLSLRAVARKVGVATTSIYLHFEDRDALLRAVKVQWLDQLADEVTAAAASAGDDPARRLRAIAHAYVDAGMADPARYHVLFTSPVNVTAVGEPYLGARAFDLVEERVRAAVPPTEDAHLVTVQLWCALHGIVTLRQSRRMFPWPDLNGQVDDVVDRLLRETFSATALAATSTGSQTGENQTQWRSTSATARAATSTGSQTGEKGGA